MKNDEYKKFNEFNKINEFKQIKSESFNTEEYNKKLNEYLKTKEINQNSFDNSKKLKDKTLNKQDFKAKPDDIKNMTHSLKHSLSTITTTLTSSVLVVAGSAAIVTNVFVPNPKINFDYDIGYNSIEYRIEMNNVDESLDYYFTLTNNNESYKVIIPKDDNPDDHMIICEGVHEELNDNELYYMNILGEDIQKGSTSNFYKTKFTTKKYDLPSVKFDFTSELTTDNKCIITYNVNLSDYKESKHKYYRLDIKYKDNILDTLNLINNDFFNKIEISKEIYEDLYLNNGKIEFIVSEVRKNKEEVVKTYDYTGASLQPIVNLTTKPILNQLGTEFLIKYNLELSNYNESIDKKFKFVIMDNDKEIYNKEFNTNLLNGYITIDQEIFNSLYNDKTKSLNLIVYEIHDNKDIILKEDLFNLNDYIASSTLDVSYKLTNDRSSVKINYESVLTDYYPQTIASYKLDVIYDGTIIYTDGNIHNSKLTGEFTLDDNTFNKILTTQFKELTFEVYEESSKEKRVLVTKNLDLSKDLLDAKATLNLTSKLNNDRSSIIINYESVLTDYYNSKDVTYNLNILYNDKIIYTDNIITNDMIKGEYLLDSITLDNIITSQNKNLLIEVVEKTNKSKVLLTKSIDFSEYFKNASITLIDDYIKDDVVMNINYDINILGDYSFNNLYDVKLKHNGTLINNDIKIINGRASGTITNVLEGSYYLEVSTTINNKTYILGTKEITITYPPVDLSNGDVNITPIFNKELRSSILKVTPTILDKKEKDEYLILVYNNNELIKSQVITEINPYLELSNLLEGIYNIKLIEHKAGVDYLLKEETYNLLYPVDFFKDITTATPNFTPTFDSVNNITKVTLNTNISNKYKDNLYYIVLSKGDYFNYKSDDLTIDKLNNLEFLKLKPGTYTIKVYMKEIWKDSLIHESNYDLIYPDNYLKEIINPVVDYQENFNYEQKLAGLNITLTGNDYFTDAKFRIVVKNEYGFLHESKTFTLKENYVYSFENLKDALYNVTVYIILDDMEEVILNEDYGFYYPNDYDPLPDNNLATYDKFTINDIIVDTKTKPGYYLLTLPLNYNCTDPRFNYSITVYQGLSTLVNLDYQTAQNPTIEIEDYGLDSISISIYFVVSEGYRDKTVETYNVPDYMYIGGPQFEVTSFKLLGMNKMALNFNLRLHNDLETINNITYSVLFSDGKEIKNTVNYTEGMNQFIIEGYNQNVTDMKVNVTINYNGPYGIGNKDKVIDEKYFTLPLSPVITYSLVKANSARVQTGNNIELEFAYFGMPGNILVIEEDGVEIHRGGFSYQGPLNKVNTFYTCFMEDSLGNRVGDPAQVNIDASSYPYFNFKNPTANDVLITKNKDNTYNYYIDFGFESAKTTCHYTVKLYKEVNGEMVVYKEINSRSSVFELLNEPDGSLDISYQIHYEEEGINYIYLTEEPLYLPNKELRHAIEYRYYTDKLDYLELTFTNEVVFDKTSLVLTLDNGEVINIKETDFIDLSNGLSQVTIPVTIKGGNLELVCSIHSGPYDLISQLTNVLGDKLYLQNLELVDKR